MRQVGDLVRVEVPFNAAAKSKQADYVEQAHALLELLRLEMTRQKAAHSGEIRPVSLAFGANGSQIKECREYNNGKKATPHMGRTASNQAAVIAELFKSLDLFDNAELKRYVKLTPIVTLTAGCCGTGVGVSSSLFSSVPPASMAATISTSFMTPVLEQQGKVWFLTNQGSPADKLGDFGNGVASGRKGMRMLGNAYYAEVERLLDEGHRSLSLAAGSTEAPVEFMHVPAPATVPATVPAAATEASNAPLLEVRRSS
ncbi:MAG: hypothetical protein P1U63_03775 [Coxiellaceae bacterium]|nr:hypothetical protein [Coxiellaceae bacterium]